MLNSILNPKYFTRMLFECNSCSTNPYAFVCMKDILLLDLKYDVFLSNYACITVRWSSSQAGAEGTPLSYPIEDLSIFYLFTFMLLLQVWSEWSTNHFTLLKNYFFWQNSRLPTCGTYVVFFMNIWKGITVEYTHLKGMVIL